MQQYVSIHCRYSHSASDVSRNEAKKEEKETKKNAKSSKSVKGQISLAILNAIRLEAIASRLGTIAIKSKETQKRRRVIGAQSERSDPLRSVRFSSIRV